MGRWDDSKGGLAHRKGIRQKHRSGEAGTARSATDLCTVVPRIGRRIGADSISLGARFRANDRNATLAASSGFDQPSMIALASSRILELGARLWKGCRPSGSYRMVVRLELRSTPISKGGPLHSQASATHLT
jgi:hypothetical protein